jgi:RNA polymerase sigma-70 factor (ECF subfamily)
VTRIAAGESAAFATLFRRHRLSVYRFAFHMTGVEATAEDVTQEVFLAVMHEAGKYDVTRGIVISWLCGITRNLVRRRLERERFLQPMGDADSDRTPRAPSDPLHDLAQAERVAMLRRAVMALPPRYREAVLLCDLQELSYADAATALDCAVGTVRSRLHRGRALLAAKLRAYERGRDRSKVPSTRCFA